MDAVSGMDGPLMEGPRVLRLAERPHGSLEVGPYGSVPVSLLFDGLDGDAYERFCRSAGMNLRTTQLAVPNTPDGIRFALTSAFDGNGRTLTAALLNRISETGDWAERCAHLTALHEQATGRTIADIHDLDDDVDGVIAVLRQLAEQDDDGQGDVDERLFRSVLSITGACDRAEVTMALLAGHLPRCERTGPGEYVLWAAAEQPQRFDLCAPDYRWRVVGLIDPDLPVVMEVHSDDEETRTRRKDLAYPQRSQLRVRRFDDLEQMRDWVLAAADEVDGPLTTPDRRAILGPYIRSEDLTDTTASLLRYAPGGDALAVLDYEDLEQVFARAGELGVPVPAGGEVDEIRARVAAAACEQVPDVLAGQGAGAFVREAGDTVTGAVEERVEALESLACRILPRGRFTHQGMSAQPHRIGDSLPALETFTPLNPFAG